MSDVIQVKVEPAFPIPVVNVFLAGPGQGLVDAPNNGDPYMRQSGNWVKYPGPANPDYPLVTSLTGDEILPVFQDDENRRMTLMDQVRFAVARGAGLVFSTVAQAAALVAALALPIGAVISTAAYAVPGDGGQAPYVRVVSQPSHDGRFQDTAGNWYELKTDIVKPEMFGAVRDGATDDKPAFDKSTVYAPVSGTIEVASGRTYALSNWVLPDKRLNIVSSGDATLLGINAGDVRYLMASNAWVSNDTSADWMLSVRNITFNANSIKEHCSIHMTAQAEFLNCRFTGATVSGQHWTGETENGTVTTGAIGGQTWIDCDWISNVGAAFTNTLLVADAHFIGCRVRTNGTGFILASTVGVQMSACKFWGNTVSNPNGVDLEAGKFGLSQVMNCNFEGTVVLKSGNAVGTNQQFGPGNLIYNTGKLIVRAEGGSSSPTVILVNDLHLTGAAHIIHDFNDPSRIIFVRGGSSDDAVPFRWSTSAANPGGVIIAERHWNNYHRAEFNGRIRSKSVSSTDPIAGNIPIPISGRLSSGTETKFQVTMVVPAAISGSGSRLEFEIDVAASYSTTPRARRYTARMTFLYSRYFNGDSPSYLVDIWREAQTPDAGMSGAAAVEVTGGTGDHTVVLTFTLTHEAPPSVNSTSFDVNLEAFHHRTMSLTWAQI
jgi:hypothetical protein